MKCRCISYHIVYSRMSFVLLLQLIIVSQFHLLISLLGTIGWLLSSNFHKAFKSFAHTCPPFNELLFVEIKFPSWNLSSSCSSLAVLISCYTAWLPFQEFFAYFSVVCLLFPRYHVFFFLGLFPQFVKKHSQEVSEKGSMGLGIFRL